MNEQHSGLVSDTLIEQVEGSLIGERNNRLRSSDTKYPATNFNDLDNNIVHDTIKDHIANDEPIITDLEGSLRDESSTILHSTSNKRHTGIIHGSKDLDHNDHILKSISRILFVFLTFTFGLWIPGSELQRQLCCKTSRTR